MISKFTLCNFQATQFGASFSDCHSIPMSAITPPVIVKIDSEKGRLLVLLRLTEFGPPVDETLLALLEELRKLGGEVVSDANEYEFKIPNGVNWVPTWLVATVFGARARNGVDWQFELRLISFPVDLLKNVEPLPSDFRSAVCSILETLKESKSIAENLEVSKDIDEILANFKEYKGIAEITDSLKDIHWDDKDKRPYIWAELMFLDAELRFSPETGEGRLRQLIDKVKDREWASWYKPIVKCLIDEYNWTTLEPLKEAIKNALRGSD